LAYLITNRFLSAGKHPANERKATMEMKAHMNGLGGLARHFSRARHTLWLLASVAALLAMVLGAFAPAQPAAAEARLECSEHTLSVTLTPGATDTFNVVGTLCSQGPAAGKTVQLLLHGATYARYYWDLPYQAEHYSYVHAATKRGYATFNLDRIGNGASDHPDGNLVYIVANGFVVHQVVEALRAGEIASQSFEKVIVVGHSMGSFSAANYAGSFPGEADGIILTGFLHDMNWPMSPPRCSRSSIRPHSIQSSTASSRITTTLLPCRAPAASPSITCRTLPRRCSRLMRISSRRCP